MVEEGLYNGNYSIQLHSQDVQVDIHPTELMEEYKDTPTVIDCAHVHQQWYPRHYGQAAAQAVVE